MGESAEGRVDAVILAAMVEEARALLSGHDAEPVDLPLGEAHRVAMGRRSVVVVRTGIGLVNAAAVSAIAVQTLRPRVVLSSGAAGGLAEGLYVGDVVVGTDYAYFDADATPFGYQLGQVPGMPLSYAASEELQAAVHQVHLEEQRILPGMIVSGDAFVAGHNVDRVRRVFPRALAVDMESAAHAQVGHLFGVPYLAVRSISDLCGPTADADLSLSLHEVSARAGEVVRKLVNLLV